MTIRSKHNNLLNYFLYDEKDLSKSYLRKCKKFLNKLKKQMENK
jgi:molybdopterin/thiamine biosynthesis adenylyltransferase